MRIIRIAQIDKPKQRWESVQKRKSWEVLAIVVDGTLVCKRCLRGKDEIASFNGESDMYAKLFFNEWKKNDLCGRCLWPILDTQARHGNPEG